MGAYESDEAAQRARDGFLDQVLEREPRLFIPEVRKLNLGPDDILVLRFQGELSPEACERLREDVRRICGIKQRVMILEDGSEIDVIHDGEEPRTAKS